ncbi:Med18 protein-domain-containing protein [Lineolata rhizophorae]|uniref:Mediator of RNA polymerase II transcription subunit 18 n=1 Tax=Lineolata rhizophorae TaxID=578093 RepID=A0A6A6PC23_9PEZI|nr:Med18 protein-domain-containing protein [Lineolata rhizophorae]
MHELFLSALVPASRLDQIKNILAGLTAQQPTRLLERHAVYRPIRIPPPPPPAVGGSQGVAADKVARSGSANAAAAAGGGAGAGGSGAAPGRAVPGGAASVGGAGAGGAAGGRPGAGGATPTPAEAQRGRGAGGAAGGGAGAGAQGQGAAGAASGQGAGQTAAVAAARELHYLTCVREVDWAWEEDEGAGRDGGEDLDFGPWQIRFEDLPEAGRVDQMRDATLRFVTQNEVMGGDVDEYMRMVGYRFVSEFVLEGYQFVLNNVVLHLHRVLQFPAERRSSVPSAQQYQQQQLRERPRGFLPPFGSLHPLDSSGAYMLKTTVRLADGTRPDLTRAGLNELYGFRDTMKGVLELKMVQRLALDTRVK